MMADQEVKSKLTLEGNPDGLVAAMSKARTSVKEGMEGITGAVEHTAHGLERFTGVFGTLVGVIAGGAAFKHVISETTTWMGEVGKLSRTLGVSTETASALKVAMHGLGIEGDTVTSAVLRIAKSINSDGGAAIERLGVKVKDSNGHLRNSFEIMTEVNSALGKLKAGTDRNTAGMTIYSRAWGEVQSTLRLTKAEMEESAHLAEKLHLVFSSDDTAQVREYKRQVNELKLVQESLSINVGRVLLPQLQNMGIFFNKYGPESVVLFASALKGMSRIAAESGVVVGNMYDRIAIKMRLALDPKYTSKMAADETALLDKAAGEQMAEINDLLNNKHPLGKGPAGDGFDPNKGVAEKMAKGLSEDQRIALEHSKKQVKFFFENINDEMEAELASERYLWNTDKFSLLSGAGLRGSGGVLNAMLNTKGPKPSLWTAADQKSVEADVAEKGLNSQGLLSEEQQKKFDQNSMQAFWAEEHKKTLQADLQVQAEFYAQSDALSNDSLTSELNRQRQSYDYYYAYWVDKAETAGEFTARKIQLDAWAYNVEEGLLAESERRKYEIVSGSFGNMATVADAFYKLSHGKNQAAFRSYQALKSGETIISTASGVMKAMSSAPNFYVGLFQAAATAAMGAVQLASIWSASPEGSRGGVSGVGSYDGGYDSRSSSPIVIQPMPQNQGQTITYNFYTGDLYGDDTQRLARWVEDRFAPAFNDARGRGVNINVHPK